MATVAAKLKASTTPESRAYGEAVRELRERRDWDRQELADRLNYLGVPTPSHGEWSTAGVIRLEHGRVRNPPIGLTRALTTILGCTMDDLMWPKRRKSSERLGWYVGWPPDLGVAA